MEEKNSELQGWNYVESYEFFDHVRPLLSDSRLEYQDWLKAIKADRDKHQGTDVVHQLGFSGLPVRPFTPVNTPNSIPTFSGPFTSVMPRINEQLEATADELVNAGAEFVQAQISRAGQALMSQFGQQIGIEVGAGGDGGTTKGDYSGGSNYNKHGLSLGAQPINSSFRTTIVPRYRPLYSNDGNDNDAPLVMFYGEVFPEIGDGGGNFAGDTNLQRFLNIDVINQWSTTLARKLRLNSYTSTLNTKEYIFNFIRVQMHCLSIYYFFVSVIAHINVTENRNTGMIKLYEALSAEDLQEIARLELLLKKTPIDPRINQFVFHLYNNYKQSHLPGAPLYKMIPVSFVDSTGFSTSSLKSGSVAAAIDMLGSRRYKQFVEGYVQAFPDVDSQLLMYTGVPNFDPDHLTFVRNFPHIGYGSTASSATTHLPTAANRDEKLTYNLDTDAPDGWTFASSSIWVGSNDQSGLKLSGGFGGPKTLGSTDSDGYYQTELLVTNLVHTNAVKTTTIVFSDAGQSEPVFTSPSTHETQSDIVSQTYKICRSYNVVNNYQRHGCQIATPVSVSDMELTSEEFANFLFTPPNTTVATRTPRSERPDRPKKTKNIKK
uniref:Uncharacterized protein n=1 Tax=viral metagenome TaxID=1070528 RepID=A0A2V0RC53_9ZZZZ